MSLMSLNIVILFVISCDHEQDEISCKVNECVFCAVIQTNVLNALEFVINALAQAILRIGRREDVEGSQSGIPICCILLQQQLFKLIALSGYFVSCVHLA